MATMREASRQDWESRRSVEHLNSGSLQRIADAAEKMASNYTDLQNERDLYERWFKETREREVKLTRRVSALHGVITRMKRKAAAEVVRRG